MKHPKTPEETKTAIITGGASGIGRALAKELAGRGVHVVIADRQAELARDVAAEIRERGGSARAHELDVRDAEQVREVVEATFDETGRLDYLFNNAGIGVAAEMCDYDLADWDDVIDVNLRGVAYGIHAAYPRMIDQGFGHIINTASVAGFVPTPIQGSYTATKHAVVGLSKTLRIEARKYGVRVSALCPGAIRTPILEGGRYGRVKIGLDPAELAARIERLRPMEPALLAPRVLRAVERNRAVIIEPWSWRLLCYIERISPWLNAKLGELAIDYLRKETAALRDV